MADDSGYGLDDTTCSNGVGSRPASRGSINHNFRVSQLEKNMGTAASIGESLCAIMNPSSSTIGSTGTDTRVTTNPTYLKASSSPQRVSEGLNVNATFPVIDHEELAARMARLTGRGSFTSNLSNADLTCMENHSTGDSDTCTPPSYLNVVSVSHAKATRAMNSSEFAFQGNSEFSPLYPNVDAIRDPINPNSKIQEKVLAAGNHGMTGSSDSPRNSDYSPRLDTNSCGIAENGLAARFSRNSKYTIVDIAEEFHVSLNSTMEIDMFVKDLRFDTRWTSLPVEISDVITDIICDRYKELSIIESKDMGADHVSGVAKEAGGGNFGATINSPIIQSVDVGTRVKDNTYAGAANSSSSPNKSDERLNIGSMISENSFEGVNISIPRKVVEKVSARFTNTLYGYFIGKRVAFPVVEYYAKNNWGKFGLKRIMMNSNGFFFFKFDTQTGYEAVLEGGPWMIRNSPIILKKWTMKTSLQKEELTRVPVWVKLHDVPIQVFEEEGISLIATYLGKPLMLDSFTTAMCKESWGRSSFARCLIEIDSGSEFKETISIGIPDMDGPGFTKETIRVEYEWKPPRCPSCTIFGHAIDTCPKRVPNVPAATKTDVNMPDDGFQQVRSRKRGNKGKSGIPLPKGVPLSKGFQVGKGFMFNPKASSGAPSGEVNRGKNGTNVATNQKEHNAPKKKTSLDKGKSIDEDMASNHGVYISPNVFSVLGTDDEEEDVENIYDESANLLNTDGRPSPMGEKS